MGRTRRVNKKTGNKSTKINSTDSSATIENCQLLQLPVFDQKILKSLGVVIPSDDESRSISSKNGMSSDEELSENEVPVKRHKKIKPKSRTTTAEEVGSSLKKRNEKCHSLSKVENSSSSKSKKDIPAPLTKSDDESSTSDSNISDDESQNTENEEESKNEASSFNWKQKKEAPVKLLIQLRADHHRDFEQPKQKKIQIWKRISKKMSCEPHNYVVTAIQCKKKWDNLFSTYKNTKDNLNKTGRSRKRAAWPYFEDMDKLLGYKSSVNPKKGLTSSTFVSQEEEEVSKTEGINPNIDVPTTVDTNLESKLGHDDKEPKLPVWVKYFTGKIEEQQTELLKKFEEKETEKMTEIKEIKNRKINLLEQIITKLNN